MQFNSDMIISLAIFIIAYIVIITEKVDRIVAALGGGILMVLVRLIEQKDAFAAIDMNTLGLLISMMVIVMITKRTGIFEYISIKMVKLAGGEPWKILVLLSILTAFASAFLDNVTTILLVLPIVFDICRELGLKPIPFVISQIFASNIGGTATLIGDPPNIMIASQVGLSFMDFVRNIAPVIIVILALTILAFVVIFKKYLHASQDNKTKVMMLNEREAIKDRRLLTKSLIVLTLTICGFVLHDVFKYSSTTIAIAGAVLLLAVSGIKPEKILKEVEWKTILFFAGLFMLVGGIEQAGVLKFAANGICNATGGNTLLLGVSILWVSAIASAFVDNIPFTATMIPLIKDIGSLTGITLGPLWWALSLGACLGGNGTIIGASANVVASGMSEEYGHKITFGAYFKVCFPIMLMTVLISTIYLVLFYFI